MRNLKKNNKGFSLVELIVVVLIMAIIAVALAPQILKWVNNSRKSNDINTMQQLVSNCQTSLSNENAMQQMKDASGAKLEIKKAASNTTVTLTPTTSGKPLDKFIGKLREYSGLSAGTTLAADDFKVQAAGGVITITISAQGKVEGKYQVDGTDVDLSDE